MLKVEMSRLNIKLKGGGGVTTRITNNRKMKENDILKIIFSMLLCNF